MNLKLRFQNFPRAFMAIVCPKDFHYFVVKHKMKYCTGTLKSGLRRKFKFVPDKSAPEGQIHLMAYGKYYGSFLVQQYESAILKERGAKA